MGAAAGPNAIGGAERPWCGVAMALIEALHDAAWLVDPADLRVIAANSAAEGLFGVDHGALCGRAALDLAASPEDFVFWGEAALADPDADFEGIDSETVVRSAAGTLRTVRRRVVRLTPAAGEACFFVQLQDRGAQRRAEAEHARRLSQLNAMLEATADGILVTDLAGRIVNFNRRFAALWGLPGDVLCRRRDDDVLAWLQRSAADPGAYMRRLAAIDEASTEPTHDTLRLASGRVIERVSLPQRCDGVTIGRVWSFRAAGAQSTPPDTA